MAITITSECINCGACEPECPNNAIYEGGAQWRYADGTSIKGLYKGENSKLEVDAEQPQSSQNNDVYFIVSDKCTECVGFHDEPQCAAVCPVDCCIKNEEVQETREELLRKKSQLHS